MKAFVNWMQGVAVALGGPGLIVIGFLDSSFLSFPMINDLMLIGMVTRHKSLWLYYALMATLGSVLGCLALYSVARKGGEAFLLKRFKSGHVEGGRKLLRKYGLLVVIVPALLPPPAPFKIFVLLAGVAAIPIWQFAGAVFIARGLRYGGEGLLAAYYGEAAAGFMQSHGKQMGLGLAGVAVVAGGAWIAWQRHKARS
jgi:membrane protein YqaA with SNARE-associated domain